VAEARYHECPAGKARLYRGGPCRPFRACATALSPPRHSRGYSGGGLGRSRNGDTFANATEGVLRVAAAT